MALLDTCSTTNMPRYQLGSLSNLWHPGLRLMFIMRPSSLGGGRILSVCPSVPLSLPSVTSRHLANYNDTTCTFQHAPRAAYRTAISAAQILVLIIIYHLIRKRFLLTSIITWACWWLAPTCNCYPSNVPVADFCNVLQVKSAVDCPFASDSLRPWRYINLLFTYCQTNSVWPTSAKLLVLWHRG